MLNDAVNADEFVRNMTRAAVWRSGRCVHGGSWGGLDQFGAAAAVLETDIIVVRVEMYMGWLLYIDGMCLGLAHWSKSFRFLSLSYPVRLSIFPVFLTIIPFTIRVSCQVLNRMLLEMELQQAVYLASLTVAMTKRRRLQSMTNLLGLVKLKRNRPIFL
eukprot:6174943-Pleurochrysis_carterae.AAC.1